MNLKIGSNIFLSSCQMNSNIDGLPLRTLYCPMVFFCFSFFHYLFFVSACVKKRKRKLDLYSAPLWEARLWNAQAWISITQFLGCKVHHTCLYLIKHSPDGATTDSDNSRLIAAYYSFINPKRMKGWVGLVGTVYPYKWLRLPIATSPVQASESSPVRDRRSTTELHRQGLNWVCIVSFWWHVNKAHFLFDLPCWTCNSWRVSLHACKQNQYKNYHFENRLSVKVSAALKRIGEAENTAEAGGKVCVVQWCRHRHHHLYLKMCGVVILFRFGFGFWKNSDSVQNEFGLDIVVIYYLCNTLVFNLQQILQRYCAVLNELWLPDFDTVVNKLWRHSQQQQQVSNVIAF